jgi:hypothetical protein
VRQPKDELVTSGQPIGRNGANPVCWGYFRLARLNEAARRRMLRVTQSDGMYALSAKAAIFRRARRLLPALAAILIPASVLSSQVCHAFGREVEKSNPIHEILHSAVGKVAIMNGATTVSASFVPVPGGSSVNQTGDSVLIRHLNLQGTASVVTLGNRQDEQPVPGGE